jgi:DNA mismatch endonuclease (patch repair protein)
LRPAYSSTWRISTLRRYLRGDRRKRSRATPAAHLVANPLTQAERSAHMRRVRRANTSPELAVRRALHRLGYRYRLHQRRLPGTPDLVFASRRKVVFVHGCFWHRHPGCPRTTTPQNNSAFWAEKFAANLERDQRKEAELRAGGWSVLVVWECEIRDLEALSHKLMEFLGPPRVTGCEILQL